LPHPGESLYRPLIVTVVVACAIVRIAAANI